MNDADQKHERRYTLKQAVDRFFQDGPLTVSSLRTEIRKGRLVPERIAGKLVVTEAAISRMFELCREEPTQPAYRPTRGHADVRQEPFAADETKRAQAAAFAAVEALKEHSRAHRPRRDTNATIVKLRGSRKRILKPQT